MAFEKIRIRLKLVKEGISFTGKLLRHNASVATDSNIKKMQYTLLRENHVIEKGMSMKTPRKGFGQAKVTALLNRLLKYADLYLQEDKEFLLYPIGTIANYIDYTKRNGTEIPQIEVLFQKLLNKSGITEYHKEAGIYKESKANILAHCDLSFKDLLYSRHSIRYFSDAIPSKDVLDKALMLAQRTPSACNRQGWLTHIFLGIKSHELIKWQGGARGFEDEIHCAILVTANMNAFLSYEPHQAYVDGGLYAMNLINALHSLGLGTIPLSCGFYCDKLKTLESFGIADNEVPIVIIGVGEMLDEFNVAVSIRKDISKTNKYH